MTSCSGTVWSEIATGLRQRANLRYDQVCGTVWREIATGLLQRAGQRANLRNDHLLWSDWVAKCVSKADRSLRTSCLAVRGSHEVWQSRGTLLIAKLYCNFS
jgi:hypothetical protein